MERKMSGTKNVHRNNERLQKKRAIHGKREGQREVTTTIEEQQTIEVLQCIRSSFLREFSLKAFPILFNPNDSLDLHIILFSLRKSN